MPVPSCPHALRLALSSEQLISSSHIGAVGEETCRYLGGREGEEGGGRGGDQGRKGHRAKRFIYKTVCTSIATILFNKCKKVVFKVTQAAQAEI